MRIAVAGTRSFGAAVLKELYQEQDVLDIDIDFVIAPPEDKAAEVALRLGLPVVPGIDRRQLQARQVDLLVCAHTHAYVGRQSRLALRIGAIGYHPSLLPRHRGRDAVRWTIKMGDPVAGGSVYWLSDNIDAGPIESQKHVLVAPKEDHHGLWRDKLFPLGVRMLRDAVERVASGTIVQQPQDEKYATWEPSWERAPLMRPELIEIGAMPEGYHLETVAR